MVSDSVAVVTEQSWEREVLASEVPVLVDFWAPWCGPCRALAPLVADAAERLRGRARVASVNVDQDPDLAARHGIRAIPSLLLFRGGDIVARVVGGCSRDDIVHLVDHHLERHPVAGAPTA